MSKGPAITISLFYVTLSVVNGASSYSPTTVGGDYGYVRGNCRVRGGDLATFDSSADVESIYSLCAAIPSESVCYVGFNDLQTLNVWRWVDGSPFDQYAFEDPVLGLQTSDWDRCGCFDTNNPMATPVEDCACAGYDLYGVCEFPVDICDCYELEFLNEILDNAGNRCYRYQANFCDNVDTIKLPLSNADNECGFNLERAFVSMQPPRLSYNLITDGPPQAKGIEISGLVDGDILRVCFNPRGVRGTQRGGNIQFYDESGDDACPVTNTLPDFCPGPPGNKSPGPKAMGEDGGLFIVNMEGEDEVKGVKEPMMMTFIWTAVISCIVSIIVVSIAYIACIKPLNKTQNYEKVLMNV